MLHVHAHLGHWCWGCSCRWSCCCCCWWWRHDHEPSEKEDNPRTINCWFHVGLRAVILKGHMLHREHRVAVMEKCSRALYKIQVFPWLITLKLLEYWWLTVLFFVPLLVQHQPSTFGFLVPLSVIICWQVLENWQKSMDQRQVLPHCLPCKKLHHYTHWKMTCKIVQLLYSGSWGSLRESHLMETVPTTFQTVIVLMPEIWQITWKVSLNICKSYCHIAQCYRQPPLTWCMEDWSTISVFLNRNQSLHSHQTPQIQLMQNGDCLPAREYSCASQDPESECEFWMITNLAPKKCCDVVFLIMKEKRETTQTWISHGIFLKVCHFSLKVYIIPDFVFVSQIVQFYSFLLWHSSLYMRRLPSLFDVLGNGRIMNCWR